MYECSYVQIQHYANSAEISCIYQALGSTAHTVSNSVAYPLLITITRKLATQSVPALQYK